MAAPEILVIDASVAVKWFSDEPHRDKALEIRVGHTRGDLQLEAPSLLPYEVGNALRYNPKLGIDEVRAGMKALEDLQILFHPFASELAQRATEVAYRLGITLYDAAYVALASLRNGVLYTADGELVTKASADNVLHISEYRVRKS